MIPPAELKARSQFALQHAGCITDRQSQGMTLPAVLADVRRAPGMSNDDSWLASYVMMSRATSLDGLLLVGEPDWEVLEAGPPATLVAELERLAARARATAAKLVRCRALRDGLVPPTAGPGTPSDCPPRTLARVHRETLAAVATAAESRSAPGGFAPARLRAALRAIGSTALGFASFDWLASLDATSCELLLRLHIESAAPGASPPASAAGASAAGRRRARSLSPAGARSAAAAASIAASSAASPAVGGAEVSPRGRAAAAAPSPPAAHQPSRRRRR